MAVSRRAWLVLLGALTLLPMHGAGGLDPPAGAVEALALPPGPTFVGLVDGDTLVWNRPAPSPGHVLSYYHVWGRTANGTLHHLGTVPPVSMFANVPRGYVDYGVVPEFQGAMGQTTWACWYVAFDPPEVTLAKCNAVLDAIHVVP